MERSGQSWAVALLLLAALTLVGESLLPGRVLLPLLPDDFPAWRAGRAPEELAEHPAPNRNMSDVVHLLVPGLATTREAVGRGELPTWDPSQALGLPHIDQVHYGVYYPPAWLAVLLGVRALGWIALFHLGVAAWGTLAYLRAIRRSLPSAVLGAACFAFSAWTTARLQAFPVVGAAVWLPVALWGFERLGQGDGHRYGVLGAMALAMSFLAGFPQVTLWVVAVVALVEIVRPFAHWHAGEPVLRPGFEALGAFLLSALLIAPQVLPTAEYLATESARSEQTVEVALDDVLDPSLMWHLVSPDHFASAQLDRPDRPHPVALLDVDGAMRPVSINRAETSMGIGVVGLVLALVAMVFGRSWRTWVMISLAALSFAVLLIPAFMAWVYPYMPLLHFGSPRRLLFVASFALAVLASGGLDLLRTQRVWVTAFAWVLSVVVLALAVQLWMAVPSAQTAVDVENWAEELATVLGSADTTHEQIFAVIPRETFAAIADATQRTDVIAIAVAIVAILMFRPRSRSGPQGWTTQAQKSPHLVTALVVIELALVAWPLMRPAPVPPGLDTGTLRYPAPQIVKELRRIGADDPVPLRVARVGNNPPYVTPNLLGSFGLHDTQCYAPMAPRRVSELLDALQPGIAVNGSSLGGFISLKALRSPVLDMLGIRALLTDQEFDPDGFEERGRVGHVRVLENTEALPRAQVVGAFEVLPLAENRLAFLSSQMFDPTRHVVLESDPLVLLERIAQAPPLPAGAEPPPKRRISVTDYAPGRVRLEATPGQPAIVVFAETYHEGWTATVNGEVMPVWPANHAVMAVPIPHRKGAVIELSHEPSSVQTGLLVGGVGWLLALVLLVMPARTRRPAPLSPFDDPDEAEEESEPEVPWSSPAPQTPPPQVTIG